MRLKREGLSFLFRERCKRTNQNCVPNFRNIYNMSLSFSHLQSHRKVKQLDQLHIEPHHTLVLFRHRCTTLHTQPQELSRKRPRNLQSVLQCCSQVWIVSSMGTCQSLPTPACMHNSRSTEILGTVNISSWITLGLTARS